MLYGLKTSEPLPEDWSPTGLLEAAGLFDAAEMQRGIDEWHRRNDGDPHDECLPVDDALLVADVVAALDAEKTLSKAARKRILEALELE